MVYIIKRNFSKKLKKIKMGICCSTKPKDELSSWIRITDPTDPMPLAEKVKLRALYSDDDLVKQMWEEPKYSA